MKKFNRIAKVVAIFSFIGVLLFVSLLEYHRSFNPYSWLNSSQVSVYSRDLWNQRKWIYAYSFLTSFIFLVISVSYLLVNWIANRKTKISLK